MSSYAVSQALSHVAQLSRGRALDRSLRVTLNFHPDRLHGGRPILLAMARDGVLTPRHPGDAVRAGRYPEAALKRV